jgi:hypothetical protein
MKMAGTAIHPDQDPGGQGADGGVDAGQARYSKGRLKTQGKEGSIA